MKGVGIPDATIMAEYQGLRKRVDAAHATHHASFCLPMPVEERYEEEEEEE